MYAFCSKYKPNKYNFNFILKFCQQSGTIRKVVLHLFSHKFDNENNETIKLNKIKLFTIIYNNLSTKKLSSPTSIVYEVRRPV